MGRGTDWPDIAAGQLQRNIITLLFLINFLKTNLNFAPSNAFG
jgi:hypothetical protein